ncbi:MAG: hypothetical protein HC932_02910 [Thermales bacterium]|nr:hypothetical protein [Thermales bacterium]
MIKISKILETIKNNNLAEVLSLSSVGPAFFVITKNITECKGIFEQANLDCIETELFNTKYIVEK